eukprot:1160335-Pelagomonas_calceolata.AAC.4
MTFPSRIYNCLPNLSIKSQHASSACHLVVRHFCDFTHHFAQTHHAWLPLKVDGTVSTESSLGGGQEEANYGMSRIVGVRANQVLAGSLFVQVCAQCMLQVLCAATQHNCVFASSFCAVGGETCVAARTALEAHLMSVTRQLKLETTFQFFAGGLEALATALGALPWHDWMEIVFAGLEGACNDPGCIAIGHDWIALALTRFGNTGAVHWIALALRCHSITGAVHRIAVCFGNEPERRPTVSMLPGGGRYQSVCVESKYDMRAWFDCFCLCTQHPQGKMLLRTRSPSQGRHEYKIVIASDGARTTHEFSLCGLACNAASDRDNGII